MVVKKKGYTPDRGDIVHLDFDPTKGHEQKGLRPAFVISPRIYNQKSGLVLCMPITKHSKGYPFEVSLPSDLKTFGVILADQIRSVDWKARSVQPVESVSVQLIAEVQAKIDPLLF
jgi:mRNA interferase MazF